MAFLARRSIMVTMRRFLLLFAFGTLGLGCAATAGGAGNERVVVAVDARQSVQASEVNTTEVTELVPPVAPEPAQPGRRRLSQTVTLGQGSNEGGYAPAPSAPTQGAGGNSQSVVVNNNVTVVNSPPVYYGGYGGYGGGYGGRGTVSTGREGFGGGGSRQAWAPNGWEGSQRTAAPGRTPGVGGNFAPAPSFGPAPMK
jgi:hypothetical protein